MKTMQIGEVAEQVGLSLRTIRFYEEAGLVVPSGRSVGGFRLYSELDLERLDLVKRLKPLGYSVEEIGDFLTVLDSLTSGKLDPGEHQRLLARLEDMRANVDERIVSLAAKVDRARGLARHLAELTGGSQARVDP